MIKYLIGIVCALTIFACNNSAKQEETTEKLPEDFVAFYERFHADSTFQMDHVLFPLEGLPAMVDSATLAREDFRWEKASWQLHRPIDPSRGQFTRKYFMMDDQLIIETIRQTQSRFAMQRRFAKISGEWYLIYYAGMNPVQ